ncbi:MAG: carboxymuconolactone decarboxylase family protein [Bifidobacterium sp.]|uniref:Carboxymuconolactone decarboxylase family protein n=1 Tax=Bifidobacterium fermentum TaxID=3059035 RepID=A0AB39U9D2_9BIFI
MKKQTAGRDILGEIAPTFAELNDDVLFGEVWARESQMSVHDRSVITCASLMSQGLFPQLESHLKLAKANGVSREEIVGMTTQLAFYAGWPKAWSTFSLIAGVYGDENGDELVDLPDHGIFPLGEAIEGPNFTGTAWLHMMTDSSASVSAGNVTFAPGCINRWHSHPEGQLLLVTAGHGWEQQEGRTARRLEAGDVVFCPANVKHWHGATKDSSFTHIAVTPVQPGQKAADWFDFPDLDGGNALE